MLHGIVEVVVLVALSTLSCYQQSNSPMRLRLVNIPSKGRVPFVVMVGCLNSRSSKFF